MCHSPYPERSAPLPIPYQPWARAAEPLLPRRHAPARRALLGAPRGAAVPFPNSPSRLGQSTGPGSAPSAGWPPGHAASSSLPWPSNERGSKGGLSGVAVLNARPPTGNGRSPRTEPYPRGRSHHSSAQIVFALWNMFHASFNALMGPGAFPVRRAAGRRAEPLSENTLKSSPMPTATLLSPRSPNSSAIPKLLQGPPGTSDGPCGQFDGAPVPDGLDVAGGSAPVVFAAISASIAATAAWRPLTAWSTAKDPSSR